MIDFGNFLILSIMLILSIRFAEAHHEPASIVDQL